MSISLSLHNTSRESGSAPARRCGRFGRSFSRHVLERAFWDVPAGTGWPRASALRTRRLTPRVLVSCEPSRRPGARRLRWAKAQARRRQRWQSRSRQLDSWTRRAPMTKGIVRAVRAGRSGMGRNRTSCSSVGRRPTASLRRQTPGIGGPRSAVASRSERQRTSFVRSGGRFAPGWLQAGVEEVENSPPGVRRSVWRVAEVHG